VTSIEDIATDADASLGNGLLKSTENFRLYAELARSFPLVDRWFAPA
jgi:hypothetical protein